MVSFSLFFSSEVEEIGTDVQWLDPNTMYSPFKVSLSRSITSKLRIDDNVGLTLRLVSGRNFWVPTEFLLVSFVLLPLSSLLPLSLT